MPDLRTHGLVYGIALTAVAPMPKDLRSRDIYRMSSAQLQQVAVHDRWSTIGMILYSVLMILSLVLAFVLIEQYDLIWPAAFPAVLVQAPWVARLWLRRQRIFF